MNPTSMYSRRHRSSFLPAVSCFATLATLALCAPVAQARETCENTGSFAAWKRNFRAEVVAAGVSADTIRRTYDETTFQPNIIRRDRRQSFFALSFVDFSKRLVSSHRLRTGAKKLQERAGEFRRAHQEYGVPAEVITAFWALESDFGAGITKQSQIFDSLATLAYDCRRPELFRRELISAMKIIDRGYLTLPRMAGSWAGELGQTQFLPSHYLNFAVDADGDGRRDLIRSDPDIIHSTANYIRHLGWRRGEPWLEEVRVPARLPWAEADLDIKHPVSKWRDWGVTRPDGGRLKGDAPASLLLPMGRNGPAFLAYRNFDVYPEWNQSLNYAMTAAYLATRLAGAPPYDSGRGTVENFDYKNILELQHLLNRRGFDTGGIDGKLGAKSRVAVKAAQLRYGLPADSYPSAELIRRLR
jgi:lytic murein transglycosylase